MHAAGQVSRAMPQVYGWVFFASLSPFPASLILDRYEAARPGPGNRAVGAYTKDRRGGFRVS